MEPMGWQDTERGHTGMATVTDRVEARVAERVTRWYDQTEAGRNEWKYLKEAAKGAGMSKGERKV